MESIHVYAMNKKDLFTVQYDFDPSHANLIKATAHYMSIDTM